MFHKESCTVLLISENSRAQPVELIRYEDLIHFSSSVGASQMENK
jgi:hypothetical protein